MSFDGMANILSAPAAWQATAADRLRKMVRFCAIVCGLLTLSFFSVTSAFADKNDDKSLRFYMNDDKSIMIRFYMAMARLNARAIACQHYVSIGRPPINQQLMQYWNANNDVKVSRSILYITVKEIRAKLKNLTLAEGRSACKEELRHSIIMYVVSRIFFLNSPHDRGTPPRIDLDSVGLQE